MTLSYVLTAIAHDTIDSNCFLELKSYIESLTFKVNNIKTLSQDKVFDFYVSLKKSDRFTDEQEIIDKLREEISVINTEEFNCPVNFDLIIQKDDENRKNKKLFCFDMDSTLIYQEVIELIAEYAGVEKEVEDITTRAMNGELDFTESLKARVQLLKGIPANIWDELKKKLEFTKGDFELTKGLRKAGCKLAVLSGGFINLAEYVKEVLNLDYAYANQLQTEIIDGEEVFNGETLGVIVDGYRKAELTKSIAEKEGISLSQTVCVGDGSNDLPMMTVAGFGIAWNAKPRVQKLAPCKLNTEKISDIFYILGYTDEEIEELIK